MKIKGKYQHECNVNKRITFHIYNVKIRMETIGFYLLIYNGFYLS